MVTETELIFEMEISLVVRTIFWSRLTLTLALPSADDWPLDTDRDELRLWWCDDDDDDDDSDGYMGGVCRSISMSSYTDDDVPRAAAAAADRLVLADDEDDDDNGCDKFHTVHRSNFSIIMSHYELNNKYRQKSHEIQK